MSSRLFRLFLVCAALAAVLPAAGCEPEQVRSLSLTSPAFADNAAIPGKYSCDGQNTSPELKWSGAPSGAKSLALIMHDPDAPRAGGFTHWVIFNIPPTAKGLTEAMPKQAQLTDGTVQGNNGRGEPGYTGPCPPAGPAHHYEFKLYALDRLLILGIGSTKDEIEAAMAGHILAQTQLTGLFQRS